MRIHLETERLILRYVTADDIDAMVELDRDPEVMRYLSGGSGTSREVIENERLPNWLRWYDEYPGFGLWVVIEKLTGAFLGRYYFRPTGPDQVSHVDLGYRFRRSAWGRGYATEGARALIRKGFEEQGILSVTATAYGVNVRSRRVLEKLGMSLARTFRPTVDDLIAQGYGPDALELWPGDDVEYTLTREAWELQTGSSFP